MRLLRRLLLVVLLSASPVLAGQISGSVQDKDGSALKGGSITIICSGKSTKGATDSKGRYSILVPQTGACSFKVNSQKPIKIFSGDQPSRYDFRVRGSGLKKR